MSEQVESYHPLILEYRDSLVDKNETLIVLNNRIVLTELPDMLMKVYVEDYNEVENRAPKDGEYKVDYMTGVVLFGGSVANKTPVSVSYKGRGIVQYPAQRIYSYNKDADIYENLQQIVDEGNDAISTLSSAGDIGKRTQHSSQNMFFGNNDWTSLVYGKVGNGTITYNEGEQGVEVNGSSTWFKIAMRIPIDPESTYHVRAKVKKSAGDGTFYIGADSLSNTFESMSTDEAKSYNYFGTNSQTITSGQTVEIEGSISGYNDVNETDKNKFDPEAKYFDLVIISNHQATEDITKTVIKWLEIYRAPKSLNIDGNTQINGELSTDGKATLKSGADLSGQSLDNVDVIRGNSGVIAESTDEWLRINQDGSHTNGVFFGSSVVRTDDALLVGSSGGTFLADGSSLTYKGNNIGVADGTVQTNFNADKLDSLDQSVFMRKDANSNLTFDILVDSDSNGITWSGLSDTHKIYVEETTNAESTNLVILNEDNGTDGTIFRNRDGVSTTDSMKINDKDVAIYRHAKIYDDLTVNGVSTINDTLDVTGKVTALSDAEIDGQTIINNKVFVDKSMNTSPLISLAIGDADTGIDWVNDGDMNIQANGIVIAQLGSTFNVVSKLNANSSLSVTGDFDVTNNATVTGSLDAGNTTVDTLDTKDIHVASGNSIYFDGGYSGSILNMNNNSLIGVNTLTFSDAGSGEGLIVDWGGTDYEISVSDEAKASNSVHDHMHFYTNTGNFKFWKLVKMIDGLNVTGDIVVSGNVDGVDISSFKSSYDSHNHTNIQPKSDYTQIESDLPESIEKGVHASFVRGSDGFPDYGSLLNVNTKGNDGGLLQLYTPYGDNYGGDRMMYRMGKYNTNSWTGWKAIVDEDRVINTGTGINGGANLSGDLTLTLDTSYTDSRYINSSGDTLNGDLIMADNMVIRPATPEGTTLGTPSHPFKDVYIGANSLYVDGKKVVSSQADTIDISTDLDQHMSINTSGLGTTRMASAKESIVYSGSLLTLQSLGDIDALSGGRISFTADSSGDGIEFVSESTLGNVNFTSGNMINLDATNGIKFFQRPKVNTTDVQLVTDSIANSRIAKDSNNRFVTDSQISNWDGKLNKDGDTMVGELALNTSGTALNIGGNPVDNSDVKVRIGNPTYAYEMLYTGSESGSNNSFEFWTTSPSSKVYRIQQDGKFRLYKDLISTANIYEGSQLLSDKYVKQTGDTMTGTLTVPQINLNADGAITSKHNDDIIFKDHGNGNVTVSGAGGNLYLGYLNTTAVKLDANMIGSASQNIISTDGTLYYQGENTDNRYVNKTGDTMTGHLTLNADPTNPMHATTKQYVDAIKQSLDIKDSVRVATTSNITLSGAQTIDSVALSVGDRVLVKNQSTASENGIYEVQTGAWTRSSDMDESSDISSGAFTFVEEGTQNGNMGYTLTTDGAITIGTTALGFTRFSGAGQINVATGLYKTGNTIGISTTGVGAGTYTKVSVNSKGQVTSASNPTTLDGYGISDAMRVNQSNSVSGDLTITKSNPTLSLVDSDTDTSTFPRIEFKTNNSQGVQIRHDEFDSNLPEGGYALIIERTDSNTQTENKSILMVEGNIYSDGNKVWTTGNDGSGSGMDADLLDGLQGSSYMRTDANTSTSGTLTLGGNQVNFNGGHKLDKLRLNNNTRYNIGTELGTIIYGSTNVASETLSHKFSGSQGVIAHLGEGGTTDSYFNGNVGIGVLSPETNLHVKGANTDAHKSLYAQSIVESGDAGLQVMSSASGAYGSRLVLSTGDKNWSIHSKVDGDMFIGYEVSTGDNEDIGGAGASQVMNFKSDGSVGIGTSSPSELLHVSGNGEFDGDVRLNSLKLDGSVQSGGSVSFLNGGSAQSIRTKSVLASDAYSDSSKVPSLGAYFKGGVRTDGVIQAGKNAYQVTFTAGESGTKTITHNLGSTNYMVTVGANTVNRHAGWTNKAINTVDIEIDDSHTSDITVDVIIMAY